VTEIVGYTQWVLAFFMYNLIGQGILAFFIGERRHTNSIYHVIAGFSRPLILATRKIMPRIIVDAHVPFVTLFILIALRVAIHMYASSQGWIVVEPVSPPVN